MVMMGTDVQVLEVMVVEAVEATLVNNNLLMNSQLVPVARTSPLYV